MKAQRLDARIDQALRDSGLRIVVTGAGGWLGMATLELLRSCFQDFGSRVACFGSAHRELRLIDGTVIEQRPLAEMNSLGAEPTLVLHLAFLTKDRAEAMAEDDYVAACRQLRATVMGTLDRVGTEAVFVASSGAAAHADDVSASPAMRLYGRLKREDEDAFADWASASGKRAVIARIFNLSGPHINKHQSYALASFILDGLAGRPISVNAPYRVVRSYVAIRELMSLVFALLLDEQRKLIRFDSGGQTMEMGDIAQAVASVVRAVPVHRPSLTVDEADEYHGDAIGYDTLLRECGLSSMPFPEQIAETADFLTYFQSLSPSNGVAKAARPC